MKVEAVESTSDQSETQAAPSEKIPRKRRTSMENYESSQAKVQLNCINCLMKEIFMVKMLMIKETQPLRVSRGNESGGTGRLLFAEKESQIFRRTRSRP